MSDDNLMNDNVDLSIKENSKEKEVNNIFLKWKKLQDIILEEKLLKDALYKDKNNDYSDIKPLISDYLETKLKIRKIIGSTKILHENIKIEYLSDEKDLNKNINKFLFFLRKNIDYIIEIIFSIANHNIKKNDKTDIDSFIEFISNNIFDEFPSEKRSDNYLMIIIYKILEEEICKMDYAMPDTFIQSNFILNPFLNLLSEKEEYIDYLEKTINPFITNLDKEVEEKNGVNLSLIEIKNKVNSNIITNIIESSRKAQKRKSVKEDNINLNYFKNRTYTVKMKRYSTKTVNIFNEEVDKNELIYYLWKNDENFFNDLTPKNLYQRIKEARNEQKRNLYKCALDKTFYGSTKIKNIFSNERLMQIFSSKYFDKNLEQIVKEYKSNYVFIHKNLDTYVINLMKNINLIHPNIRYICKIIYILISAKFPKLPKYSKNSFIGKFIFDKYIFPCLNLENNLVNKEKIISFETKRCIDDMITILSYANKCEIFDNYNNTEKVIFNNYIIEIIPILDEFYNSLINIPLPGIIQHLIDLKVKEIEMNQNIKTNLRKRKNENNDDVSNINKKNLFLSELIKKYKTKNKKSLSWNLEFICFNIKDLLYILSLINNNKNKFSNLPKYDIFNGIFQTLFDKVSELKELIENQKNDKIYYLIFNEPKNNIMKVFKNTKISNSNIFSINSRISKNLILRHIKYCLKYLLQEIDFINKDGLKTASTNEKFVKLIIYYSFVYKLNKKIPLYYFAKYILDNIKSLEEKYLDNDFEELYSELYNDELSNLKILNKYWRKIIINNHEKIKVAEKINNRLKSKLKTIQNSIFVSKAEKIIYFYKTDLFVTFNPKIIKKEKEKEEKNYIKIDNVSNNDENEIKISSLGEFINLFSENYSGLSNDIEMNPYNLLISDINKGENKNNIYQVVLKYLASLKNEVKSNYKELPKKGINEVFNIIKNFTIESIYKLVFPKSPTKNDIFFCYKTKTLDWITQKNLGINNIELYDFTYPELIIKKFDESKSLKEKLNYIKSINDYINNIFKFNRGKAGNIGQDELTPVLQYIIVKSQPERIVSNINFLKCFLSHEESLEDKGFYISQIDSAIAFILSLNHIQLDMNEEEFNKNVENSKLKNNLN